MLIKDTDVFIYNSRLDVVTEWGIDYSTLSKYNSRLLKGFINGL
jgi:crotonobetainyl-CoA:carnitine CoA-transferase CaiB-like acyl-CoA transferase